MASCPIVDMKSFLEGLETISHGLGPRVCFCTGTCPSMLYPSSSLLLSFRVTAGMRAMSYDMGYVASTWVSLCALLRDTLLTMHPYLYSI